MDIKLLLLCILHVFLIYVTSGLWLLILGLYYTVRYFKKKGM